jgi:aldehyde dehydrogenase (NAD+)
MSMVTAVDTRARLRDSYDRGLTRPLAWRRRQLSQMKRMLTEHDGAWLAALAADVGKPATEGWATEIGIISAEIDHLLRHLDEWVRPQSFHVPLKLGLGRARVIPEPLGVALVIAPWNYPLMLLLTPMAAALAAGNAVVGKPSELAPATSAALARLVPHYLDQAAVAVVEGGPQETADLLAERWDHILYTGNGRVGRIVMEAAAKHLTPVTLELGGKTPTLVDSECDLAVTARRIAWGKFLNAGQSCLAPDYVLVHEAVEEPLLQALTAAVRDFYGDEPRRSPDFARIVNARHHSRLQALLDGVAPERLVIGGDADREEGYFSPTIVRGGSWDEPLMADEIFGPILPVLAVPDMEAAIATVNRHPKPLAVYVFTSRPGLADRVVERTSSGGVCVNGTVMQIAATGLPFGGVGASGMGAYHGRYGFDTFSHGKAVLQRATWPDPAFSYPPYTRLKDRILRLIM